MENYPIKQVLVEDLPTYLNTNKKKLYKNAKIPKISQYNKTRLHSSSLRIEKRVFFGVRYKKKTKKNDILFHRTGIALWKYEEQF